MDLNTRLGTQDAALRITPRLVAKASASAFLGLVGMFLIARGRKQQSLDTMLLGAALILGSLFLF